ncbi:DNA-binding protein [Flavimobilis marinus]|uniref:DNA-directed DNA polymerase n=1 Tax=Flavimobilis marinus TaxID=285351 RepID=A0A1I2FY13_9MICO|nr:DNA polymerase III subunit delta [Flavimobilis marinus]GHG50898.1 DNA-binding protein [Flavimobilis marinus]SFF09708.1 DNA polymerase III, delta subunit [Flavimobilis marinus]
MAQRPARRPSRPSVTWDTVELAPVVLVQGAEGLLVDRAVDRLRVLAREADSEVEVVELEASTYASGMLAVETSPSLFADRRHVVVHGVEATSDAFITDMIAYLDAPADDVVVVLEHRGGQRGKKLLDAVKAHGGPVVACEPIKKDSDKSAFVTTEMRTLGRRADAGAVRALVEALGSDLRELAAACSRLAADTTGTITEAVVGRYYGGRVEATGFRVADAAVAGNEGEAVSLLRHALATGVDPVPIVAVLAMKLRTLAKVAAMRGRRHLSAADLGMAPWQVDRARKDLQHWTPEALAEAITAVAEADAQVKGAGRDPVYAVERAVLRIAAAARA